MGSEGVKSQKMKEGVRNQTMGSEGVRSYTMGSAPVFFIALSFHPFSKLPFKKDNLTNSLWRIKGMRY